jgi:hypothetical protein
MIDGDEDLLECYPTSLLQLEKYMEDNKEMISLVIEINKTLLARITEIMPAFGADQAEKITEQNNALVKLQELIMFSGNYFSETKKRLIALSKLGKAGDKAYNDYIRECEKDGYKNLTPPGPRHWLPASSRDDDINFDGDYDDFLFGLPWVDTIINAIKSDGYFEKNIYDADDRSDFKYFLDIEFAMDGDNAGVSELGAYLAIFGALGFKINVNLNMSGFFLKKGMGYGTHNFADDITCVIRISL